MKVDGMKWWELCRVVGTALVIVGLVVQSSPLAWAQIDLALETQLVDAIKDYDPALCAGALGVLEADPELQNDPELASLFVETAVAASTEASERLAVTTEVVQMEQEGVEPADVIPVDAVKTAAREEFEKMQAEAAKNLGTLPEGEREEARLMMEEAEKFFTAWEAGESYVPSAELKEMADQKFKEWLETAPPEERIFCELEYARWSGGLETTVLVGGELGGPFDHTPGSLEDMNKAIEAGYLTLTDEQRAMAEAYFADPEKFMTEQAEKYMGEHSKEYEAMMREWVGMEGMTPEAMERYAAEFAAHASENTALAAEFYAGTHDTQAPGSGGYVPPSDGAHTVVRDLPGAESEWMGPSGLHNHPDGTASH